jgi:uncharacterized protein
MRFKINDIGDEGLVVDVRVTAEWLAAACPELDARPAPRGLALRGRIDKSGDDYLLRGTLQGALETTCARCLEPARLAVDTPLAVTFVPSDERHPAVEVEDPEVVPFAGNDIDIGDDVRDEILLAIPINPVCAESCRGLCPVCGGNRNAILCDCEERQRRTGSKLGALAKLKL